MRVSVVIPAYQPQESLYKVVQDLQSLCADLNIIIVNDGSSSSTIPLFERLAALPQVTVLHHAINLGKGQALKTAFNHFLVNFGESHLGVVTADADGQHLAKDIIKACEHLQASPDVLWLGSRQFSKDVPFRSRFGNIVTRKIFKFFIGKSLQDTQTGLRAIPKSYLNHLLRVRSTGYEYELDMLVKTPDFNIPLREFTIDTVYIDNNKSSHFNVLIDSLKIYFVFFRFCALSVATMVIDFIVFLTAVLLGTSIFSSIVLARTIAGIVNFTLAKSIVFRSSDNLIPELAKYVALVALFGLITYASITSMVTYLGMNVILSKILIEGMLFVASFSVQRLFVFNKTWRLASE